MITESSTIFDKFAKFVSVSEGGKSSNPNDNAAKQVGAGMVHTNMGITWYTFKEYAKKSGIDTSYTSFLNLTKSQAKSILYQYCVQSGLKQFKNDQVALFFCEMAWMSGYGNAYKILKRALINIGALKSNETTNIFVAANRVNQKTLLDEMYKVREGFYRQIVINDPTQKGFLTGWLTRLEKFKTAFPIATTIAIGTIFFFSLIAFYIYETQNNKRAA